MALIEAVHAREIEIDDPGDPALIEQRVIAEQVRVHRGARQVGEALFRMKRDFGFEFGTLRGVKMRADCLRGMAPPPGAARILGIRGE